MPQAFASPGEALEHYGVKGMKWGERKEYDPHPRDATGKVATKPAESKATPPLLSARKQAKVDKFMQRSDVLDTRISEFRVANEALATSQSRGKAYAKYTNDQAILNLEAQKRQAVRDAEAVQKGKLTRKQKQIVVGAVVVGGLIGYSMYAKGQQSGALNSWKLMGQARLRGETNPFAINEKLKGSMSAEKLLKDIAKPVNPNYSKPGGKMNCRRCTYAYELRRRGFDVHATTSAVGWGQSESGVVNALTTDGKDFFRNTSLSTTVREKGISALAPGDKRAVPGAKIVLENLTHPAPTVSEILKRGSSAVPDTLSSSKKVLDELAKQPNGARGEVMFKFPNFGHSMAYEIVDGVPHIFDSQKGTLYNSATKMVESKWDGFTGAEIRRLDNLDLDMNFLSRWATNMGG
jgi:hypothetical protein